MSPIPLGPPIEAINAGILTEFTTGFVVLFVFTLLATILRMLRGGR